MIMSSSSIRTHGITCRCGDGIPAFNGGGRGYYVSRGGTRMLVMECKPGQRVRINDTIEVVVLATGDDEVRLAIDAVDSEMHAAG